MATLQQSYDLWKQSEEGGSAGAKSLRYRTQASLQEFAVAILSENPTTPAREEFAVSVVNNPVVASVPIWNGLTTNPTIVDAWVSDPSGNTVPDGDIEFVVTSIINALYPLA